MLQSVQGTKCHFDRGYLDHLFELGARGSFAAVVAFRQGVEPTTNEHEALW